MVKDLYIKYYKRQLNSIYEKILWYCENEENLTEEQWEDYSKLMERSWYMEERNRMRKDLMNMKTKEELYQLLINYYKGIEEKKVIDLVNLIMECFDDSK